MNGNAKRIAVLNDQLRKNPADRGLGKYYVTDGIAQRGSLFQSRAIAAVIAFDVFTSDNDPYSEHDFGSLDVDGARIFWKIDYYSKDGSDIGSDDPGEPTKTERVLTIMLAEEY